MHYFASPDWWAAAIWLRQGTTRSLKQCYFINPNLSTAKTSPTDLRPDLHYMCILKRLYSFCSHRATSAIGNSLACNYTILNFMVHMALPRSPSRLSIAGMWSSGYSNFLVTQVFYGLQTLHGPGSTQAYGYWNPILESSLVL